VGKSARGERLLQFASHGCDDRSKAKDDDWRGFGNSPRNGSRAECICSGYATAHGRGDCERLRWDRGQCYKYNGRGRTYSIAGALNGEASPGGVDIGVTEHALGGWKSELTHRDEYADPNVINQK